MFRHFAPMIGLLAAFAPALAHAQTNLDQGKSASQIFASACAECHKAAHALAKGQSVSTLSDFLREHYTTNPQQAAALAAYVKGGSGEAPIGVAPQSRGQRPKAKQANAIAEEPKPSKPEARSAPGAEDRKPANAKLRRPRREALKPKDETNTHGGLPNILGTEAKHPPATASRTRRNEPKVAPSPQRPAAVPAEPPAVAPEPAAATAREPAAAAAEPTPSEASKQEANPVPTAAAPAKAASGESGEEAPVPRDNIPD